MCNMQTGKGASFSYLAIFLITISYLADGVVWALASFLALAQNIRQLVSKCDAFLMPEIECRDHRTRKATFAGVETEAPFI